MRGPLETSPRPLKPTQRVVTKEVRDGKSDVGVPEFHRRRGPAGRGGFLERSARQGPGEATAVARNDGSVGLFSLEPGSLGSSTAQAWVFLNFTKAQGTQGAVNFLNLALRQGPGDASANARNDGSVGLFFLEPGSLGTSTAP